MVRVFALGKINTLLKRYLDTANWGELSRLDRRLLKGFYVKNEDELIEFKKAQSVSTLAGKTVNSYLTRQMIGKYKDTVMSDTEASQRSP